MKLASSTDAQALAVGCDTPQSDAKEDKFSSCEMRPALKSGLADSKSNFESAKPLGQHYTQKINPHTPAGQEFNQTLVCKLWRIFCSLILIFPKQFPLITYWSSCGTFGNERHLPFFDKCSSCFCALALLSGSGCIIKSYGVQGEKQAEMELL